MEISPYIVFLVIAFFSVVQSLFGVGLLVFGTPTFLLLGGSYGEAGGYILPSSLLLSALQLHGFSGKIRIARGVVLYAIPFVFIGMSLSVEIEKHTYVSTIVGVMMLLLAVLRIAGIDWFSEKMKKNGRISLILTGTVHGISNQGGALLTILMSSIYNDKKKIRTNIAYAYLLFGLSQLVVLLWFKVDVIGWGSIAYVFITFISYHTIGKLLFNSVDMAIFNNVFTGFMVVYGVLLLEPIVRG